MGNKGGGERHQQRGREGLRGAGCLLDYLSIRSPRLGNVKTRDNISAVRRDEGGGGLSCPGTGDH